MYVLGNIKVYCQRNDLHYLMEDFNFCLIFATHILYICLLVLALSELNFEFLWLLMVNLLNKQKNLISKGNYCYKYCNTNLQLPQDAFRKI